MGSRKSWWRILRVSRRSCVRKEDRVITGSALNSLRQKKQQNGAERAGEGHCLAFLLKRTRSGAEEAICARTRTCGITSASAVTCGQTRCRSPGPLARQIFAVCAADQFYCVEEGAGNVPGPSTGPTLRPSTKKWLSPVEPAIEQRVGQREHTATLSCAKSHSERSRGT